MWNSSGCGLLLRDSGIVCQAICNIFNKYANLHEYPVQMGKGFSFSVNKKAMSVDVKRRRSSREYVRFERDHGAKGGQIGIGMEPAPLDNNNKNYVVKFETPINQFVN